MLVQFSTLNNWVDKRIKAVIDILIPLLQAVNLYREKFYDFFPFRFIFFVFLQAQQGRTCLLTIKVTRNEGNISGVFKPYPITFVL